MTRETQPAEDRKRADAPRAPATREPKAKLESPPGAERPQAGDRGPAKSDKGRAFKAARFDWASFIGSGATGLATLMIVAILVIILGNIVWHGLPYVSWRFVTTGTATDMFDVNKAGILPMIFGTA